MSNCRAGCARPGSHATWGECARAADIQIDRHALKHGSIDRDKDRRLSRYEDARSQGLQPKSTRWKHVREAFETGGTTPTPITPTAAVA